MDELNKTRLAEEIESSPEKFVIDFLARKTKEETEKEIDRARIKQELETKEAIGKMRSHWSWCLLVAILGIVLFDFFFITALGFHWFDFNNEKIVFAFVIDSLAKIAGLAFIVVKFLFGKDSM